MLQYLPPISLDELIAALPAALGVAPPDPDDPDDWFGRALCRETDPEAFFPDKGGSTREAKRVCTQCEVRAQCLQYALDHNERYGIWGGLSERERRRFDRTHSTRRRGPAADRQAGAVA